MLKRPLPLYNQREAKKLSEGLILTGKQGNPFLVNPRLIFYLQAFDLR
jgi:hypothetical protein